MRDPLPLSERSAHLRQASILRGMTLEVNSFDDGLNLGQGVCDLEMPRELRLSAVESLFRDRATYTAFAGIRPLREAISRRYARRYGLDYDADEIVVTVGSTGAYMATLFALLDPGDEVILFEPFYPYHATGARLAGARVRTVPLRSPDHAVDWEVFTAALGPRTRAVVCNTPGNPTGKVWSGEEIRELERRLEGSDAWLVTDEIYEDLVYEGARHVPPASVGGLRERTVTISGLSKAYSITGWRLGWLAAPKALAAAIGPVFDVLCVCAPRPLQAAAREALERLPESYYTDMRDAYHERRDHLVEALRGGGFEVRAPDGAYYLMAGYVGRYGPIDPVDACYRMLREVHVAAIPSTIFHEGAPKPWLRFQFAVESPVIDEVGRRLRKSREADA